jgi:hypothetical protein
VIILDLLLCGAGLVLASQAWDLFAVALWARRNGGRRAGEAGYLGLLLALPALCCWGMLLLDATSHGDRSAATPGGLAERLPAAIASAPHVG